MCGAFFEHSILNQGKTMVPAIRPVVPVVGTFTVRKHRVPSELQFFPLDAVAPHTAPSVRFARHRGVHTSDPGSTNCGSFPQSGLHKKEATASPAHVRTLRYKQNMIAPEAGSPRWRQG